MEALNQTPMSSIKHMSKVISDSQYYTISLINYLIMCGVISPLGSVANVINMVVFYKHGLDTTINISFFSLAVSDMCSLVFQQCCNVFINPLVLDLDLPIAHTELQFHIAAIPHEMFARITCLITAFITAERCLCVVFPLHIKRIITPRRTATVIVVIYTFTLLYPSPMYITSYISWVFYPKLNRTLLGLHITRYHYISSAVTYFMHSFFTFAGFLSVLTFTLILIDKLQQKSAWRQKANVDLERENSMSNRDRATIKIVVLIAGILVVCYTPASVVSLTISLVPEMRVGGSLSNLYHSMWSIAYLSETVNSSVNIFLYYKKSTKYRDTFRKMFSRCLKEEPNVVSEHDRPM